MIELMGWLCAAVCFVAYLLERRMFDKQSRNADACLKGWRECIEHMCTAARSMIALESEIRRLQARVRELETEGDEWKAA